MKSNKTFHKTKKARPFGDENELKGKKVIPLAKKDKYFKQEIFNEIDEFEDIEDFDLEENQDDFDDIEDDTVYDEDDDE